MSKKLNEFFMRPISVVVTREDVESLLISALEGGSNSWYRIENAKVGKGRKYWHECAFSPVGLSISNYFAAAEGDKPRKGRVTPTTMQRALKVMAEKLPAHFADILNGNADAITGDVFLQLCVFGEVIYG